ncbi:hypothetical protein U8P80_19970 [Rhizobium beringeri]|nr:hypothetical protein U8P80_19970 [Rhizobium beringeri]WSH13859.1 hypothetical protein U8P74_19970 [Rhizobium beringeri]
MKANDGLRTEGWAKPREELGYVRARRGDVSQNYDPVGDFTRLRPIYLFLKTIMTTDRDRSRALGG